MEGEMAVSKARRQVEITQLKHKRKKRKNNPLIGLVTENTEPSQVTEKKNINMTSIFRLSYSLIQKEMRSKKLLMMVFLETAKMPKSS